MCCKPTIVSNGLKKVIPKTAIINKSDLNCTLSKGVWEFFYEGTMLLWPLIKCHFAQGSFAIQARVERVAYSFKS